MEDENSLYANAQSIEHAQRRYYAFVEAVENYSNEENPEAFFVRFDCIQAKDGQRFSSFGTDINVNMFNEGPFIHIECVSNETSWNEFFGAINVSPQEAESRWLIIETRSMKQGIQANEFYNGQAIQPLYVVVALEATAEEQEIIDKLGSGLSLDHFSDSTEKDIIDALSGALSSIDCVMVANVGQGNLNCFFQGGIASCYFDMGGGTSLHRSTYPTHLRTCLTNKPPVILSHWDMDHIETAVRDTSNCSVPWIVPRQALGLTHFTLALRISRAGRLFKWPRGTTMISIGSNHLIKCNGTTKNDSGIAMIVDYKHGDVLLTADAAYNHIPGLTSYNISCLLASHHGSDTGAVSIPLAYNKCWIVYSYGSDRTKWKPYHNKWKHATTKSINSHDHEGWIDNLITNRRDTMNGNVVFDTVPFTALCSGGCSLVSLQNF